jgi:hypothetical protein
MRATDEQKLEMIFSIDRWTAVVKGSSYEKELKMMRLKYIYKDIAFDEMLRDRKLLTDLRDALYYLETIKNPRDEKQTF